MASLSCIYLGRAYSLKSLSPSFCHSTVGVIYPELIFLHQLIILGSVMRWAMRSNREMENCLVCFVVIHFPWAVYCACGS